MPRNNFVKVWLDKIIGTAAETNEDSLPEPVPSTSKGTPSQPPLQSIKVQDSPKKSANSSIHDIPSSSNPFSSRESFTRSSLQSLTKQKIPNVLRATSVNSKYQIIPPLPRLYLGDNPADKLSRVLAKLDSLTIEEDEVGQHSTAVAPTDKTKYE